MVEDQTTQELKQEEEKIEVIATKDTLALVGFVLGLIGFLSGLEPLVAWPLDVAGVVLSIMGIKSVHWKGFAIAGIILGVLGFMGTTLLFLLGIIAGAQGGSGAGQ